MKKKPPQQNGQKKCPPHHWVIKRQVKKDGKTFKFMECSKCGADQMSIT